MAVASPEACEVLEALCSRIQESIAPFAGRVEYGNLRSSITQWDVAEGESVTNVALVYETPGGSTDQINISYYHKSRTFVVVDETVGEVSTDDVEAVLARIQPRIAGIPEKRREVLRSEIRRQVDGGSSTPGLVGHLNRMMHSGFKGGAITHLEMRDAMTFAVQYMKNRMG